VSVSKAKSLLAEAAEEDDRLTRHLLVGAALREVLGHEPVIVGGTAEEFYTEDEYHETDLDLCGWVTTTEESVLEKLGFERRGREWLHSASEVVVEFPESRIAGDEARIRRQHVGAGQVALIGIDDLFRDRLRRATDSESTTSVEYISALAVATAAYDRIDWGYVEREIKAEGEPLRRMMIRNRSRILRQVRRKLATAPESESRQA